MHKIRLREPWQRANVPGNGGDETVVFTRKFNCPTGLDLNQVVRLQIERKQGCQEPVELLLNGQPMILPCSSPETVHGMQHGEASTFWYDVTKQLQPFNKLEIRLDAEPMQSHAESAAPQPLSHFMDVCLMVEE